MSRLFLFGNRGYASYLLPELISRGVKVVGICTRPPLPLKRKLRMGIGKVLRQLHVRSDDGFTMPGPFDHMPTPEAIARSVDIEVLYSRDLKTSHFASRIAALKSDIIVVAGFHRLIPPSVYSLAGLAAINFHPSNLPDHKGGTPNRWVIRNGEDRTGITAHLLSDGFDTGDIIGQQEIAVSANDTWGDVEMRIAEQLASFAHDVIERAIIGKIHASAQDPDAGTYEHSYGDSDRTIDWSLSADEIRRICYAMRPKSGGLANLNQRRLCIWDVLPDNRQSVNAVPGTIIAIEANDEPIVACGDGAARLIKFVRRNSVVDALEQRRFIDWRIGDQFANFGNENID
jgi:methionyl-tRNA formyltransferase